VAVVVPLVDVVDLVVVTVDVAVVEVCSVHPFEAASLRIVSVAGSTNSILTICTPTGLLV
jgi:hypothetical protein